MVLDVKCIGRFVCNASIPLTDDLCRVANKMVPRCLGQTGNVHKNFVKKFHGRYFEDKEEDERII